MSRSTACLDWRQRLAEGRTPIADLPVDQATAEAAVALFDRLHLPDVAGTPSLKTAGGEWFRDILRAAFGSIDQSGGRYIREVFLMVPKKNSKTTNAAALGLVALLLNARPYADMLIVAPTTKNATTCYRQAAGMIAADPAKWLPNRFHVVDHEQKIVCRRRNAVLQIKSFDPSVLTGAKPVLVILDELHEMGTMSKAGHVLTQLRGGMVAFPDSLMVTITTQSARPPAGVFRDDLTYARRVRDGEVEDPSLLPCLYELPPEVQSAEDKPWRDPALWPQVLPNLGRSISLDRLKTEYAKAREKGAHQEAEWASQHLNVEIGIGLHADRWVGADLWLAAAEPGLTLDAILKSSDVCTVGIDGGGLDDLLGLAVIGRHRDTRRWRLWTHAWAHPVVKERRKEIAPQLDDLAASGDLTWCTGPTDDVDAVGALVARIQEAGLLPRENGVGLDPWGIGQIVDELAERQVPQTTLVGIKQGVALTPAIQTVERKLADGTMTHCGQALMAWAVGNAKVETRGSAVTITKETAGRAKIDPVVATFNAAMLMARNPVASNSRSYLTDSEMVVLA